MNILKKITIGLLGISLLAGIAIAGSGFVISKSLVADGNMEAAGTTSWTAGNSATLSKETTNPYDGEQVLRVTRNGDNNGYASQAILTTGETYNFKGCARSDGNATPRLTTSGGVNVWFGTTSTDWQCFNVNETAGGTVFALVTYLDSGNEYTEWDNLTVTAVKEQFNNAEKNLFVDGNMEKAGTGDWSVFGAGSIAKDSDSYDGSQSIKVIDGGDSITSAYQDIPEAGTYRIYGFAKSDGTGVPRLQAGGLHLSTLTNSTEWQYFDEVFESSISFRMYLRATSSGDVYFDNVTITKYTPEVSTGSLSKQLVAWYPLNTSWLQSATVASDRKGRYHGTMSNITGASTYFSFNGTSSTLNIGAQDNLRILGDHSGGIWLYTSTVSGNYDAYVWAANGDAEAENVVYVIRLIDNDIQLGHEYGAGTNDFNTFSTNLETNTWYHVVSTRDVDTNEIILYVDGEAFGSPFSYTSDPTGGTSGNLTIGSFDEGSSNDWSGRLSDMRMFDRTLTAQEVKLWFDSTCALYSKCN